jgi:uncharacterized protein (TIGR02099 family)
MVLLAIYVSVGRLLASNMGVYGESILAELNSRVPFTVEADQVMGEWRSFSPQIVLSGLRVSFPDIEQAPLELTRGSIGLDVLASLRTRSLKATRLELQGLSLSGELDGDGRFRLTGFAAGNSDLGPWVQDFLLNIQRIALLENTLELTLPSGESRLLDLELELARSGSDRQLTARLTTTRGAEIQVLGEGVGNPFQPDRFRGELYLDVDSSDLGAVRDMLAQGPPPIWAEGALNVEAWLTWDRGKMELESRLEASELLVIPDDLSWEVPLQRLVLEARMVERRNRRTIFIADAEVHGGGQVVHVPRAQLDLWGEAMRVRAENLDLAPINALATGLAVAPPKLAEVFRILNPRGRLETFQLSVGDLSSPGADWELAANFSDVAVDSWKGAPGVEQAAGYAELDQAGGFVLLDSQQFSMQFPTVYREPLAYDDFNGTIYIDWDELGLQLSSGLVSATAPEGQARVLFGLSVPFQPTEVGIEMDLLVGLRDSEPDYRAKYLPYILNAGLLDWLADSVGEGKVEQAGFIWRGSLRRDAGAHRTIQVALNISDTELDYHPEWPAVEGIDGTLLIDDTDVSVWSENARLHGSRVHRLSAEAWMGASGQMMLAIDGSLRGPAADGLTVLNNSLLRQYIGDAFAEWQLQGGLDTRLQLQINLADRAVPPQVVVDTVWHDVDIAIQPGNLPVLGVGGDFAYTSADGFSSRDLAGTLWDQPLSVDVRQANRAGATGEGLPPVEVALSTTVDLEDVRQWLDLDLLRFASGRTDVDLRVLVEPGVAPVLSARSVLAGAALDLPPPWTVDEDAERRLIFQMPLAGDRTRLDFQLEGGVHLALAMEQGALAQGALAFDAPATLDGPPGFLISGQVSLLDVAAWDRFLQDYLSAGFMQGLSDPDPVTDAAALPAVTIDELAAERVLVFGQELADVVLSLDQADGRWRLSARTDWLDGDLALARSGDQASQLVIGFLDLAGLDQLDLSGEGSAEPLDLPDLNVELLDLRSGEEELGALTFQLRSATPELRAEAITGELYGLKIESGAPGQLRWMQGQDSQTELDLRLAFDDFGDTLTRLGYQRILETEDGVIDLALRWPGAPQDFSLQEGSGSVLLNTGAGSFLDAPGGAEGALRVVGILDLASMVQRLSLSHMFESGIPFDTLEGETYLRSGTIDVRRLDVKGASSRFQFSGVSEVAGRTLDAELVATLPVANNLPWVAALAGGLPVAAGVFVVSKVFEKQFDLLSSAVYRIEGNWDDPQVKFDRIWDDGADRLSAQAAAAAADPQAPDPLPGLPDLEFAPDPQGHPAIQP